MEASKTWAIPEIQSECRPRQDLSLVSHHRHFVQCGLPIEDNDIIILHMPLHLISDLQMQVASLTTSGS